MHKRNLSLVIIGALLLPLLAVMLAPSNVAGLPGTGQTQISWVSATIDMTSNPGSSVSAALDSEGFVHVSYYAEDDALRAIMYATNKDGTWATQRVDSSSNMGSFNSIAIDANDRPWIIYYDSINKDLRYATMKSDGSWAKGLVDSSSDVGKYCDIAFSPAGSPAVSYYDADGMLKVAFFDGSKFKPEAVASMAAGSTWINFFSDGRPVVVYRDMSTTHLYYALKTNGEWSEEPIDGTPAGSISAATMGPDDRLMVTYTSTATGLLRFSSFDHGNWTSENLPASVASSASKSIAVDGSGSVHITYYSTTDGALMYMDGTSGIWDSRPIDTNDGAGVVNAVCADKIGKISMVYVESSGVRSTLKYLSSNMAVWKVYKVDTTGGNVGRSNDIAVDLNGKTHLVYFDGNALIYATDVTGSFVSTIVDAHAGQNPSIAVDVDGAVHISYHDQVGKHLKYASNQGGEWTVRTIDNSDNVGYRSAIIVDPTGNITIIYTQDELKNLKYVVGKNNDWQGLFNLDGSKLVDTYSRPSLSYDKDGVLHCSYIRSQHLYHVQRSQAGWWGVPTLVDGDLECSGDTDIVANPLGKIFISYHGESSKKGLRLAIFDGTWTKDWVASSAVYDQGNWNSLTLDRYGQPQIAYSGPYGNTLEFAAWYGSLWQFSTLSWGGVDGIISSSAAPYGAARIAYYDEDDNALKMAMHLTTPSKMSLSIWPDKGSAFLSWTGPIWNGGAPVTGYKIYRGESLTDLKAYVNLPADTYSYNDTDVEDGKTYYYAIKACNSEGPGDLSDVIRAEIPGEGTNIDYTVLTIVAVVAVAVAFVAYVVLTRKKR
ncbi:MAG: fibronectin type III domain-containing protein [Methanomassiliicoccales archaeon]|nr:MAG: fibronectin type III domain-containing protein [Methanomassiliicoccales archaeon]